MSTQKDKIRLYSKLSISTILAVYFLILVGGMVRSTGSGMGCPDWPKCFGSWVPPTNVDQLPEDYQDIYSEKRVNKNLRIANYLEVLGFEKVAYQLRNDDNIRVEAEFNATKTWIEYVNRLIGVVIGFLILFTAISSLKLSKVDKIVTIVSIAAFILVLVQAWLGSIVVSTNLLPGMISIHMALALIIVALLIYGYFRVNRSLSVDIPDSTLMTVRIYAIIGIVLFLGQIFLGIQVREAIDGISKIVADRSLWIENLGLSFYIHRSYSLLIMFFQAMIVYKLWPYMKNQSSNMIFRLNIVLFALILLEILSGAVMAYFSVPAFAQPIHLLLASLIAGIQFFVFLIFSSALSSVSNKQYAVS